MFPLQLKHASNDLFFETLRRSRLLFEFGFDIRKKRRQLNEQSRHLRVTVVDYICFYSEDCQNRVDELLVRFNFDREGFFSGLIVRGDAAASFISGFS